ncbi:hypothetical protein C8Q74DRAFT_1367318 [Fomes fomentarius]|nr:hypothetical protein C8Q74DRAFT_1367318 [Fomes fomentarius]
MRSSVLPAVCAAALVLPIHAVPLAVTTALKLPVLIPDFTVIANAPTEIPNPPAPTDKSSNAMVKEFARPRTRRALITLVALPSAKPTMAWLRMSPSTSSLPRNDDASWESNHLSADDYNNNNFAEVDDAPSPDTVSSPQAPDVPDDPNGTAGSGSGSGLKPPLAIGSLSHLNTNHVPVKPDMSTGSRAMAQGAHSVGEARYSSSDSVHKDLTLVFGNASDHTVPTMDDVSKTHKHFNKANPKLGPSVHRRVLAPARYLTDSTPARRVMQFTRELVQFVSRHSLELNTDAIFPENPKSLNMSDPAVAQEAARKKNIGLINLDSNRAPKPRPHTSPKVASVPVDSTRNAVNTTTKHAATKDLTTKNTTKSG